MWGQYCPFRDITRTRKLRNDNDKTKISNDASVACLLSACGGGSIESLICSQDPTACEDPNTPNTPDTPTITTITDPAVYNALAGDYRATGSASLTPLTITNADSRTGGDDQYAIDVLNALNKSLTTPATWTMDINISTSVVTIFNSSLDLDQTQSDVIVNDSIQLSVSDQRVKTDQTNNFLTAALVGSVEYVDYENDPTGDTTETVNIGNTGSFMHLQADTTINTDGTGSLDRVTADGNNNTIDIFLGLDQTSGLGAREYTTSTFQALP